MQIKTNEEIWKPYIDARWETKDLFLISNYGRVKVKSTPESPWKLMKLGTINGYRTFWITRKDGKRRSRYVHREVGKLFLPNPENKKVVIHLNFDKFDNLVENLKWASKIELAEHHKKNPNKIKLLGVRRYSKLSEVRVRLIKRKINDPNRRTRMKMIAKQFNISEMQLYRIKSGENWSSVKE